MIVHLILLPLRLIQFGYIGVIRPLAEFAWFLLRMALPLAEGTWVRLRMLMGQDVGNVALYKDVSRDKRAQ